MLRRSCQSATHVSTTGKPTATRRIESASEAVTDWLAFTSQMHPGQLADPTAAPKATSDVRVARRVNCDAARGVDARATQVRRVEHVSGRRQLRYESIQIAAGGLIGAGSRGEARSTEPRASTDSSVLQAESRSHTRWAGNLDVLSDRGCQKP